MTIATNFNYFFPFFFVYKKIIRIFAASLVSPAAGERAVIYMKETFSNVCRCGLRTSQILYPQQADDNRGVYVVRIYLIYIFVLSWANCVVYPVWVGQCEGL
jgi:hypothetical protein